MLPRCLTDWLGCCLVVSCWLARCADLTDWLGCCLGVSCWLARCAGLTACLGCCLGVSHWLGRVCRHQRHGSRQQAVCCWVAAGSRLSAVGWSRQLHRCLGPQTAFAAVFQPITCLVVVSCCACCRSNGRGPELTPAALEAHNKTHSSLSLMSHNSARSLDGSLRANMPQLAPSAAYLARMAKVRPGPLLCSSTS